MKLYRKKPHVVQAVQITDRTFEDPHPNPADIRGVTYDRKSRTVAIATSEGTMTAKVGDWIIKGIKGELSMCKPDIFEETYTTAGTGAVITLPEDGSPCPICKQLDVEQTGDYNCLSCGLPTTWDAGQSSKYETLQSRLKEIADPRAVYPTPLGTSDTGEGA